MDKLDYKINKEFNSELSEIKYILQNLRDGRIYELTQNKGDGYLNTNIDNLEKKLNNLLSRIQDGKGSQLTEFFDNKENK